MASVAILRHVEREQDDVDQPPQSAAAEREQLADRQAPLTQVEAVGAEEAEEVAQQECRRALLF
jgi:hypothetical protein